MGVVPFVEYYLYEFQANIQRNKRLLLLLVHSYRESSYQVRNSDRYQFIETTLLYHGLYNIHSMASQVKNHITWSPGALLHLTTQQGALFYHNMEPWNTILVTNAANTGHFWSVQQRKRTF